jgi:hypothetical protein
LSGGANHVARAAALKNPPAGSAKSERLANTPPELARFLHLSNR